MKKYTMFFIIIIVSLIMIKNMVVEADESETSNQISYNYYSEYMCLGESVQYEQWFYMDDCLEYRVECDDNNKLIVDNVNNEIISINPGTATLYFYYTIEENIQCCDVYEIEISEPYGYYKLYTIDENGEKKYLEMTDTIPQGSSLRLGDNRRAGVERIKQIWKFESVSDKMDAYIIRPALDLDYFVRLDVDYGMIYIDSYTDKIYTESNSLTYYYNEWLVGADDESCYIQSAKKLDSNNYIDRFLFYNDEIMEIFAGSQSLREPIKWYFEKVNYMPSELFLYDMYSNSNEIVTERWIGCNETKDLESLEIFVGIYSGSLIKKEVEWSSSNESIATVDKDTGTITTHACGEVTITATPKDSAISPKSYVLNVLDFEEGVYYIKNTLFNKYLASEGFTEQESIIGVNNTSDYNAKWLVSIFPNGGYGICLLGYGLDGDNDGHDAERYYLSVDESNCLKLVNFNHREYRDIACWDLLKTSSNESDYCIGMSYTDVDIEYYNYITMDNTNGNVYFGVDYMGYNIWELENITPAFYYEKVDFAYDNGFSIRYNGNEINSYLDILDYCKDIVTNEFWNEFCLELEIESEPYELFVSPPDLCDKADIYSKCPGENICTNVKDAVPDYYKPGYNESLDCTNSSALSWEFRPFGNKETAVLFSGHNLYNDDGSWDNYSYRNPANCAVMICSNHNNTYYEYSLEERLQLNLDNFANTVVHEMGHAFGAIDHYHTAGYSNGSWSCGKSPCCSVCGVGAYRRSKNCVMNDDYSDNYHWCDECKFDILFDLNINFVSE